jgi:hypothetical protein
MREYYLAIKRMKLWHLQQNYGISRHYGKWRSRRVLLYLHFFKRTPVFILSFDPLWQRGLMIWSRHHNYKVKKKNPWCLKWNSSDIDCWVVNDVEILELHWGWRLLNIYHGGWCGCQILLTVLSLGLSFTLIPSENWLREGNKTFPISSGLTWQ